MKHCREKIPPSALRVALDILWEGMVPSISLLTILWSAGCSFAPGTSSAMELLPGWETETIALSLPAYPTETHPPLAGWKLVYHRAGRTQIRHLDSWETSVHLDVDKNQGTAILFYPLTEVQGRTVSFFHPAGCVYPYNRRAIWQEGFTAEILWQLIRSRAAQSPSTVYIRQFNWPRLTQQLDRLAQDRLAKGKVFSPWFVQAEELKSDIVQGTATYRSPQRQYPLEEEIRREELIFKAKGHGKAAPQGFQPADKIGQTLYYRYIPLGVVQEKLVFPQNIGYTVHEENAFLTGNQILSVFTKKNQKPVLATTDIERYTNGR